MSTEAPPAFVPSTFGRYQLIERLAVGGMAEIFRARQTGAHGFEKILVIKRILPHLATDPEFLSMFVDEAKLQCRLQHPKIVQVFEFGDVNGQYFIALEYVDGMDSLGLLRACAHRRQRLPVRLAVHVVSEVLDALDFAHGFSGADGHQLAVVHRDVSPSNVFISRRGDVKLGDFGIARAVEKQRQSKTQAGTLKGKYGYMAPEQVIGGQVDCRADLFAVGIVLAEMLMGRRLFTAANDLDVLLMVRDARLDRLNRYGGDIPAPLREILAKGLARDPDQRFATAGQMRDALYDFLFSSRQRVTASDLGAFMEEIQREDSSTTVLAATSSSPPSAEPAKDNALMGENTRAGREAAERQQRAVLAASRQPSIVQRAHEIEEGGPSLLSPEAKSVDGPLHELEMEADDADQRGSFSELSPARALARLAAAKVTGQLVVEQKGITKEIYLVDGAPEFVASNVPSERFGEYLVAHGVISPGELSMALAILPRFEGKLGDTLVGLSLLRPLEVFRYLTRQVREKIIDVFAWEEGGFRFYEGRVNKRESFPLGLDAFEIVGAGVAGLPLEAVQARLEPVSAMKVRRLDKPRPTPELFRVGAGPRELWLRLDGKRTVGEWMRRYDQPDQLLTLCRTLYLLIECELAVLEPPA